jgi:CHAT domain-containing protein/tetratricopeptide (TPR) repeat protein
VRFRFVLGLLVSLPAAAASTANAGPSAPGGLSVNAGSSVHAHFDEQLARADSLLRQRRAGAAAAILDSLRFDAASRGAREQELKVLLAQARLNGLVGLPRPGRASAAAALELASVSRDTLAICQSLRWLAVAAQLEGAMPEAGVHAQRLLDLARPRGDRFHEGQGLLLLAYGDLVTGNTEAAEPEYEEATRAFVEVDNLIFELMARQGLGQILQDRGDLDGARRCYLRVLEGSRRLADPFGEARALNDLGALEFTYGDPSAAVAFYRQALDLQVSNGDLAGSVVAATNLAIAHTYMGEFEEAMALLTETQQRCEAAGYRGAQAAVLEQMGMVLKEQGEYADAASFFRAAAGLAAESSPDRLAHNLVGLAESLAFQDSIAAGLAVLEERFGSIRRLVDPEALFDAERIQGSLLLWLNRPADALVHLREAERIGRTRGLRFLVGTLAYTARCHDLLGRPDSARFVLQCAVDVWETERASVRDPGWREQLENDGRRLYTEVARCILADSAALLPAERARAAFDALQRFKARTLRERMLGAFSAQSDSTTGSGATPEAIRASVTLAELQDRWLGPDELLLDLFLGDDGIYLFGVTRSECRASRVECEPKDLRRSLHRYRELVATRPDPLDGRGALAQAEQAPLIEAAGRRLSALVLSPVADLLRSHERILLVLDGDLNRIPVEAWPFPSADDSSMAPEPLLARWRITRIPSATLLRDQRARAARLPAESRPLEVLAILGAEAPDSGAEASNAPPRAGRVSTLSGAAAEVRWLRRSFRDVRVRSAEDSGRWSADLARCDVIHLASHVRVDDVHPWRSGLPQLRAQQIAGLRLPARLVVLAGCESAGGRLVSGEGVLGLTTAFASASVPSVVATLWPVSDRATNRLTRAFYSALAEGRSAGEALRMAQRAVRDDPRTRHPFYWAGFVLVGEEGTGVPLRRRWMGQAALGLLAALAVAVAGAGLTRWRRARRSR